ATLILPPEILNLPLPNADARRWHALHSREPRAPLAPGLAAIVPRLELLANGVLLPFVLIFMLLLINRPALMGEDRNRPWANVICRRNQRDHDRSYYHLDKEWHLQLIGGSNHTNRE